MTRHDLRSVLESLDERAVPATLVAQHLSGGAGDESGTGVAVIDTGSSYTVYLSGTTGTGSDSDGLVVKFNTPYSLAGGTREWATPWAAVAGPDALYGIAATPTGAYAGGYSYSRTVDLVGDKEAKGVVTGFTAAGANNWTRQAPAAPGAFPYGGYEHLADVTANDEGGQTVLYVTGGSQSNGVNGSRFFLSKVAAGGQVLWTRTDSAITSNSDGYDVAAAGGSVYAAGLTNDDGTRRGYAVKYDPAGNLVWAKASAAGMFSAITVDTAAGALYVAGQTNGTGSDFLIERWNLDGTVVWSRTFDRGGVEAINALTLNGGRVWAVGSTTGGTAGGSDGIVLGFDPANGNLLEQTMWGGAGDDGFDDVAATTGGLHVAGTTRSGGAGGADLAYVTYQTVPVVGTVRSTFDTDAEGWTVSGDAQRGTGRPNYHSTGGNPGGHVSAIDDAKGITWRWVAPAKYLGAATANYGKYLSFNLKQSATSVQYDQDDVILSGGGFTLVADTPRNPGTAWTRYSVRLDPSAGWKHQATGVPATAAETRAVLADLTGLTIRGEYRSGSDTGGLDNVVFGADAPPVSIVGSTAVTEGNSGSRTVTLTVRLDAIASQPVTVRYATADGTATAADGDYGAASGTVTFVPGETTKTLQVTVSGDPHVERDETFSVRLSHPVNAVLGAAEAVVTIRTDDSAVGEPRVSQTAGQQDRPAVAVDAAGNSVVVWMSHWQDGDRWGVYGRRMNHLGQPLGGEFLVNQTTAGRQHQANVGMDAAGNFVVTWTGDVGGTAEVYARRYNSLGQPLSDEFRMGRVDEFEQGSPTIAVNARGEFVIAWESAYADARNWDVHAQRFDPAGNRIGSRLRVNTTSTGLQCAPTVAINNRGEAVVTWAGVGVGTAGLGVYGQRFRADGSPVGGEFRVADASADYAGNHAVGIDDFGRVVVAYLAPDGSNTGIFVQRYDTAGGRVGGAELVNTTTSGAQRYPVLAVEPDGDFTIGWESADATETNTDVMTQRFSAAGGRVGAETRMNATTRGGQRRPALAVSPSGIGAITWAGFGPENDGIYFQRFGL